MDNEKRFNRPILYQIDSKTSPGAQNVEGEKISSDSITNFYTTSIFTTPETHDSLAHILPLLITIDAHEGTLQQKLVTISYLISTINLPEKKSAEMLGIQEVEYRKNNLSMLNTEDPNQEASEKIYEKFMNLSVKKRTLLIEDLLRNGWKNKDVLTLLDIPTTALIPAMRNIKSNPTPRS